MKIKKLGALLVSAALCAGMAAPAFAYGGEPVEEVEQPVLTSTDRKSTRLNSSHVRTSRMPSSA